MGISGDVNFHFHVPHLHLHNHHHHDGGRREEREIPKGCVALVVGQGEEQQRMIVPVIYINHPLFMKLLKEAEEEYGFDQKGLINIPCRVEVFRQVKGIIDQEESHHHHHDGGHHHNHHLLCFKV